MDKNKVLAVTFRMIAMLIVLIAVCFAYFGISYGWFSHNTDVTSKSPGTSAKPQEVMITGVSIDGKKPADDSLSVSFQNFLPSDVVTATFYISVYSPVSALNFSLLAPDGCETPLTDNLNKYYYFSSQIKIKEVKYKNNVVASSATGNFLHTGWGIDAPAQPTDIPLYSDTNVAVGDYAVSVSFEFYNSPTIDQSILKNFGSTSGQVCSRTFFMNYTV